VQDPPAGAGLRSIINDPDDEAAMINVEEFARRLS
jgi:hypothetical protein